MEADKDIDGCSELGSWNRLENSEESQLYLQNYTWCGYSGEGIWTLSFDACKSCKICLVGLFTVTTLGFQLREWKDRRDKEQSPWWFGVKLIQSMGCWGNVMGVRALLKTENTELNFVSLWQGYRDRPLVVDHTHFPPVFGTPSSLQKRGSSGISKLPQIARSSEWNREKIFSIF